jgi:hypothetical protein
MFRRTEFPNPNLAQLGSGWNAGDVIHRNICTTSTPSCIVNQENRFLDTIVQKNITANGVEYFYRGRIAQGPLNNIQYYPDSGYITYANNVSIRDQAMPEEINATMAEPWFYYYLPQDTSYCTSGALYHKIYANISMGQPLWNDMFSKLSTESYKEGLGSVRDHWYVWDGISGWVDNTTLKFFIRNGIPCGTDFILPTDVPQRSLTNNNILLYPNPAYDELSVEVPTNNYELSLLNTIGQVVYKKSSAQAKERIDLSGFSSGVYCLGITTKNGHVINKKIIVQK